MSEFNDTLMEKYSNYIDILIEERRRMGESLCDYTDYVDEHKSNIDFARGEVMRLDKDIRELLYYNTFKKELLTEKEN